MSNVIPDDPVVDSDDSEVGMTSEESEKKSLFETITVFDTMLILSLVFIALATLRLLFALRT